MYQQLHRPFSRGTVSDPSRPASPVGDGGNASAWEGAEIEAFRRDELERTELERRQKAGRATPEDQERLGAVQSRIGDFWDQRIERAARLGHRLSPKEPPQPAPSAPAGPVESAGQPIQRLLEYDGDQIPETLRESLGTSVSLLNDYEDKDKNTKQALHSQFKMLDDVERSVNRHLRDNSETITDSQREEMFKLLRQTQEQHVDLTRRNVQHGHDLWLRDDDDLDPQVKENTQTLWKSLVEQSGNIKVQGGEDFQSKTLSGFAQLLQGSHGRGLLQDLNAPQDNEDRNIVISGDHRVNYDTANNPNHKPGSWASGIAYVKNREDLHTRREEGPNVGTGSYVQIAPTQPATLEDYSTDIHGKAMFSPWFVTLGHELGHARHNLQGTTGNVGWHQGDPLEGHERERKLWSNPEEYANITGEENPIRAEHEMPQRIYHGTIKANRATGHRHDFDTRLQQLWSTVPEQRQPALGPTRFGPLNWDIDQTDLGNPDLAADLQERIEQLGRDLPDLLAQEDPVQDDPVQDEPVQDEPIQDEPNQNQQGLMGLLAQGVNGLMGLFSWGGQQNEDGT
jgi:Effector protein